MLSIRLQRVGRKHEPVFRIVLTDSKNGPKSGKFLEILGAYDSRREVSENTVNGERVKHWVAQGAQVSPTVHNFLVGKKVIAGKKVNVLSRKSPIKKAGAEGEAKEAAKEATAPAPKAEAVVDAAAEAAAATVTA